MIILRVVFTVSTAATIVFIFADSAKIGEISGGKSALVTAWVNEILAKQGTGIRFTEHIIRKLAHFAEYALLGFWLMLTLRVFTKRIISHISWQLFGGLPVSVMDESLQIFIPGRAGMLRDVVIDFAGVVAGLACALLLLLLLRMFNVLHKVITVLLRWECLFVLRV
ncbi:VanZ family protein [Oscillospiraceae bacterium PP1C4]